MNILRDSLFNSIFKSKLTAIITSQSPLQCLNIALVYTQSFVVFFICIIFCTCFSVLIFFCILYYILLLFIVFISHQQLAHNTKKETTITIKATKDQLSFAQVLGKERLHRKQRNRMIYLTFS